MSESDTRDIEEEKTKSYELGEISQLESIAEELRERAGELWATESRTESKKAKVLKEQAREFQERYEERRKRWDDRYKDTNN